MILLLSLSCNACLLFSVLALIYRNATQMVLNRVSWDAGSAIFDEQDTGRTVPG